MPRRAHMTIDRMKIVQGAALLLGGLLDLWFILHLGTDPTGVDSGTYLKNAASFASLHALLSPTAFGRNYWSAGYSGFLYLFHGLGSSELPAIRTVQAGMMLSLAVMAYFLTRSYSRLVATVTLVVVALSPTLIWGSVWIGYEPLLAWLLTLPLTILWCRGARAGWRAAAVSGVLFSLALVVGFQAVIVLPVLVVLAWKSGRARLMAFGGGLLVPIGLWMARNGLATGSPVPWTTNGPVTMWIGNNPAATGGYINPPPIPQGWGHSFTEAVIHFAITSPEQFLDLQLVKTTRLFAPTRLSPWLWNIPTGWQRVVIIAQWFGAALVAAVFVLSLCGWLWRQKGSAMSLAPLTLFATLFLAINVPFNIEARNRMPVETVLLAVCVPTGFDLVSRWRNPGISATKE